MWGSPPWLPWSINTGPLHCVSSLSPSSLPPLPCLAEDMSVSGQATMLASEGLPGLPFPVFEGGFTPWCWENQDPMDMSLLPSQHHVSSNSGSDEPQSRPPISAVDERRQRRMISNRESARRSRLRKQKQLEGLRDQVNRLRMENREIVNRLGLVTYQFHLIRRDNDRLRSESVALRQRLSDIRRILVLRHHFLSSPSPCNSSISSVNSPP